MVDFSQEEDKERVLFIAAAQLRLATNNTLGQPTPEWIKELAEESVSPAWVTDLSAKLAIVEQVKPAAELKLSPKNQRVQVAAAKLRTTLDTRLGRTTPEAVKKLASEKY